MDFIPNIFIGSSNEGKDIAQKIIDKLNGFADCTHWKKAFGLGRSNFENLTNQIAFYDYAILIATGDDTITSRGKRQRTGRDNVLFEFGLFTGGLGSARTFYMLEKDTKLPSDMLGITLPMIPAQDAIGFNQALEDCVEKLKTTLRTKRKLSTWDFCPHPSLLTDTLITLSLKRLNGSWKIKKVDGNFR